MFSQEKKKVMQSSMKHQQNQPGKKVGGPILQGYFFPHASLGQNTQINLLVQFFLNECENKQIKW